jgi:hypothetical protein
MTACRFCGGEVTSTKPGVDYCRTCWATGRAFEDDFADVKAALTAAVGGTASVWQTGGGCFAVAVSFPDGAYFMLTDDDGSGIWNDAGAPLGVGGLWMAGWYHGDGSCGTDDCEGHPVTGDWTGAHLDELLPLMAEIRDERVAS